MDQPTLILVKNAVILIVFISVRALSRRTIGLLLRRHVFGFSPGKALDAAFPTFGYQKFATRTQVVGLHEFIELYDRPDLNTIDFVQEGCAEIHHLLCDYEDNSRRPRRSHSWARYYSCIVLSKPDTQLTPFTLC